jgi:uncharacterized protein YfaQ (DUF2300 family)
MSKKSVDVVSESSALMQELTEVQQPAPAASEPAQAKMSKAAKTASVYMTAQQHAAIERIAKELETNKHSVMQLAIRHFIEDYESGKYTPVPRFKKVY